MGSRAVDGCPEREMQECLDAVPGKVVEVHPVAAVITPESGHRRAGAPVAAHRPDKEDGAGHEQLPQERRRGDVQEVEIVHHEHEAGATPTVLERKRCPCEQLHRVEGFAGTNLVRSGNRRQQMRDRGKRDGARLGAGGRPPAPATCPLGHLEALLGQTRLSYPGRTVDDKGVTPRRPKGAGELRQLGPPPDQRPALSDGRRAHGSVLASAVVLPPGTRSGHFS